MSSPIAPTSELLGRIARQGTLCLTTRGRRSGLPRRVTVWFVVDDGAIGLGTLDERRDWVRNARRNPEVELEVGGARLAGRLRDVTDPTEHGRLRRAMAAKYWAAWIASWVGIGQRFTFRVEALRPIAG